MQYCTRGFLCYIKKEKEVFLMAEKLYTRYYIDDIDVGEDVAILDRPVETLEEMKENYIVFVGENDGDDEVFETDEAYEEWVARVRAADLDELSDIMYGFGCDFVEVDANGSGIIE